MAEISNVSWRSVIGSKRCQHSVTKSRSSLCEPRLRTGRNRMALSYIQGWDLNHFKEWELMCACLWQRTERFWVESRCNMDVFLLSSENIRNSIFFSTLYSILFQAVPSTARKLGAADVVPDGIFSRWASEGVKCELGISHQKTTTVGVSTV